MLIHGNTLDMTMWDDQVDALRRTYRVMRYDARGFGRSSLPDGPYAPYDDLAGLLDALAIERAHVVGLSMGGRIGVDFALAYPERVVSLITIGGTFSGYSFSVGWQAELAAVLEVAQQAGAAAARRRWLEHPLFDGTRSKPAVMQRLHVMIDDYSCWHWLNDSPEQRLDPPASQRLDGLGCPTLVIVGDQDAEDVRAIAEVLAGSVPNARLVTLPGVGHLANMEAPEVVTAIVTGFIAEHQIAARDTDPGRMMRSVT